MVAINRIDNDHLRQRIYGLVRSVMEHAKEEPTFYSEIAELLGVSFEQCVAGEVTRKVEELIKELDLIGDDPSQ